MHRRGSRLFKLTATEVIVGQSMGESVTTWLMKLDAPPSVKPPDDE
jgi:hypothetical protein